MDYSPENATAPPLNLGATYIYVIEGSILFILNTILVVFIGTNKKLRSDKASVIYLANIVYDAIYTAGFVAAGFFRLNMYYECGTCSKRF
uniref:Uncharacterized protein n=1 Tax=Acrobeloides nanus TaxID=290746 RepID=A0A914E3W9_9BILA